MRWDRRRALFSASLLAVPFVVRERILLALLVGGGIFSLGNSWQRRH